MFDIISIGSATRDVFLQSEGFKRIKDPDFSTGEGECFALGSKIEIKKLAVTTGGGGTNAAVTFGRQGFKTACVGVVGKDSTGQEVLEELRRENVEPIFQEHDDDRTAYSVILVNPNAERTILSYKGEGQHFDVNKIPFDKLETKWFFLDSLGGHYDLLEAVVKHAKDKGIKIAMNPGGKELAHGLEKLKPIISQIDIYITNQEEAATLVGVNYENEDEAFQKLYSNLKQDAIFVMSKGPGGVRVRQGDKEYSAGVPDSPVVERTGAGDAFGSGFTSEHMRTGDIKKAIQFATANASSVVTQFGAKAGILKSGDWGPWPLVDINEK
ncbi:MAG: carbohydrate kinase family protein [bacterium]|nr:carbohydrate kinase family protein [bacterium]